MKVPPKPQIAQAAVAPKTQPFKQLLAEARCDLKKDLKLAPPIARVAKAAITSTAVRAMATTHTLGRARTQANSAMAVRCGAPVPAAALQNYKSQRRLPAATEA